LSLVSDKVYWAQLDQLVMTLRASRMVHAT
jgi:hypothetical protein